MPSLLYQKNKNFTKGELLNPGWVADENCKNKKYNYIIIHGYGGSPKVNFFTWLKEKLKKLGHTAVCPDLPNTDAPNVDEQADYIINNFEINNDTVLVGHSLGGPVALRVLEKTNKKVSKVLFVDSFIEPNFDDVDREQVEKSFDWNFDFEKIKSLAGEFIVLADKNYSVIPKGQPQKMGEIFDASVMLVYPNEWHFCAEQEPEVLKLSLEQGVYPVPEKDLPLELPEVKNYEPPGTGESPLANITKWVNTKCPKCGEPAKRETNTMPQWAGSCWYYLRYIDPKNNEKLVDPKKEKYWQPVDLYVGGAEHATRHLIYSRFWHHFLFDIGVVSTPEPFTKLQHVGLIMAEDGRKMSKRWNNVINPDDVVEKYGADAMRVYEMFMGPFENAIAWSTEGLVGSRRFLERVWRLKNKIAETDVENKKLESLLHKTIKKVTNDIQNFKFNTAVSSMMILLNSLEREEKIDLKYYLTLLQILSPFAPHITEELWGQLENKESIFKQSWPKYDESLIKDEEIELVIQINGKIRDKISASADITEEEAKELALNSEKIQQWLDGKEPKKIIFVKGKLVSIVA
ncbi:MAG: alpha/beta fold hydrolase [bacterium]